MDRRLFLRGGLATVAASSMVSSFRLPSALAASAPPSAGGGGRSAELVWASSRHDQPLRSTRGQAVAERSTSTRNVRQPVSVDPLGSLVGVTREEIGLVTHFALVVVGSDGSVSVVEGSRTTTFLQDPVALPDGGSVLYADGGVLTVADLSSGACTPLPAFPGGGDVAPTVHPDGTAAVFTRYEEDRGGHGDAPNDLWAVDLESLERTRLTTSGVAQEPSFSPDGRLLLYRDGERVVIADPADGTLLVEGPLGSRAAWIPAADPYVAVGQGSEVLLWEPMSQRVRPLVGGLRGTVTEFAASADGRLLAVTSSRLEIDPIRAVTTLYEVPLDDPSALQLLDEGAIRDPLYAPTQEDS